MTSDISIDQAAGPRRSARSQPAIALRVSALSRNVDSTIKKSQRVLVFIGSLGPLGYLPASGSVTVAVVGAPLFWATHSWRAEWRILLALVVTIAAVWIHHLGDRILGEKDSRKLVWDEVAGYLIAIALLPFSWPMLILSVVVERIFDISKAPPAGWIERAWPGGWGVVGDDVIAGIYACAVLSAGLRLAPGWFGL